MDVFTTTGSAPEGRAASWTAVYSEHFAPVEFAPVEGEDFQAELRVGALDPIDFAQMRSTGYRAERTRAQAAAATDRKFGFLMFIDGKGVAEHCGREAAFGPGDILLNDNTEPMRCRFEGPFKSVTVRAREELVRRRLPAVDALRGSRLPAAAGLTRAASAMATCVVDHAEQGVRADFGAAMAHQLLDVLATCYAMTDGGPPDEETAASARRAMARQFIEANLALPDLSAQMVAESLRISPRYLRVLMAEDGETTCSLILRRRLEETAKQLANPILGNRSITEIAFSWGFNSTAHFARVFKTRFGVTPSDYRQINLVETAKRPD